MGNRLTKIHIFLCFVFCFILIIGCVGLCINQELDSNVLFYMFLEPFIETIIIFLIICIPIHSVLALVVLIKSFKYKRIFYIALITFLLSYFLVLMFIVLLVLKTGGV